MDELVDGRQSAAEHQQRRPKAFTYQTNDGSRDFAEGDRIVFLQNDRDLGVKNGLLGTVRAVEPNALHVELDGKVLPAGGDTRSVRIDANTYQSFDHGYATTIHKNQGATVDRAFVMASGTMDRHLTYVAMTRHRDGVQLYAGTDEFTERNSGQTLAAGGLSAAGRLVEHGAAPYEHKTGNTKSYFVTLENERGQRHTTWGVDLDRAMKEAKPEIGARIGLEHAGSETVRLAGGQTAERNSWKVRSAEELAFKGLEDRLSRSGAKETTLDYTRAFAERRGLSDRFGIKSEIDLVSAQKLPEDLASRTAHPAQELQDRQAMRASNEERTPLQVGPERGVDDAASERQQSPRRSAFAGLKLGRRAAAERPATQGRAEQAQEPLAQVDAPKRNMFAGLKLKGAQERAAAPEREGGYGHRRRLTG